MNGNKYVLKLKISIFVARYIFVFKNVSLSNGQIDLYTHKINKLLHGWLVCTIFIIYYCEGSLNTLVRCAHALVCLTILHNS